MKSGDFLLLYGSQTGQAKSIAENLAERLEKQDLNPRLHCMSGTEKEFSIEKESVAVIILSTTGDGDFPDTASKFCRRLLRKSTPADYLKDLSFALLGLGDTNYNNHCASPKKLEKRLLELGAKKFYETGFCDDAIGTELTAEPWMDDLPTALKRHLGLKDDSESEMNGVDHVDIPAPVEKKTSIDELCKQFVSKCSLDAARRIKEHADGTCGCVWPTPSLMYSDSLNAQVDLKVPVVMAPFLRIEYSDDEAVSSLASDLDQIDFQYPSQGSSIFTGTLIDRKWLTTDGAKKDKYEITMEFEASNAPYEPGDAFYFIIPNVKEEIDWLLKRLNLTNMADKKCFIKVMENTGRKNAKVPAYLDRTKTLRDIFTNWVDIRRFPSKAFIRALADYCSTNEDKRRLLELASTQGSTEYDEFIRSANLSILDIFHAFPSCAPPVERLLEFLPQLQPRPYSAANYANAEDVKIKVRFVYSLVSIPSDGGRFYSRNGLATGFLIYSDLGSDVKMFLKKPSKFRLLREHSECPIIMVGPGTGVAPFMSFLEKMRLEKQHSASAFQNVWLFFGCRNEKLDFLYREELDQFRTSGILNRFYAAFSREDEPSSHRYVQDHIIAQGQEISQLILNSSNLRIYICGDAKRMATDVFNAFCKVLSTFGGKEDDESVVILRMMQEDNRYVQDVWT